MDLAQAIGHRLKQIRQSGGSLEFTPLDPGCGELEKQGLNRGMFRARVCALL